jgi:hypothetical protein
MAVQVDGLRARKERGRSSLALSLGNVAAKLDIFFLFLAFREPFITQVYTVSVMLPLSWAGRRRGAVGVVCTG